MPKVLEDTRDEADLAAIMTEAEEQDELAKWSPRLNPGDLSDGGMVGGVRVTPINADGHVVRGREARTNPQQGRPSARRAWMWNGTETLLPLAYEPSGKRHDRAMHYLRKKHCLCCNVGGFFGTQCPNCVKSDCLTCRSSSDKAKVISSFYLNKEKVPFPAKFYGNINCFLVTCPRKEGMGFLSEQEMRIHARTRHRMEYQAFQDFQTASRPDELAELRRKVDELLAAQARPQAAAAEALNRQRKDARNAKAQVARSHKRRAAP